jgi:hypothetical protein
MDGFLCHRHVRSAERQNMKTILAAVVSLMTAITTLQTSASDWSSLEIREGAKDFIQNHCFAGTRYMLLDNGRGSFVDEKAYPASSLYPNGQEGRDWYAVRIVFAVSKGYGYSVGPFSGRMGIFVKGSQAGTWQIGLASGSPGPDGRWQ